MKVLLIYPYCPDTYWSFKHALRFISKKAAVPPLGLITVSAMLPNTWQKKLVDMNISPLLVSDIVWADYVFISAMYVQKASVREIIAECVKHHVKIVAGGPLFTQEYKDFPEIDHFILNEAEITLPPFLNALAAGNVPDKIYQTDEFADLTVSPVPDYHLLSRKAYVYMNLQVSRGCPFSCDFCEITSLLGRKVRMKSSRQIISELEALYQLNWRGPVSVVDDNFIGNKSKIKTHLLPAMNTWMHNHKFPFVFNIQSSINLADDDDLMHLLSDTGFGSAFIGIETPDESSLHECNKVQNENRDLILSVKKIQRAGIQVSGGFIVGFDSDTSGVFQRQIDFIQQSGIVSAMVGLLNAPKNTQLYQRLEAENRLTNQASGNNTDLSMNFTPKMDLGELLNGYQTIIHNIYSSKPFYKRIRQSLLNYKQERSNQPNYDISFRYIIAFIKSIFIIGVVNKGRREYWKLIFWTLLKRPRLFMDAITYTVYGYHFRTVYGLRV